MMVLFFILWNGMLAHAQSNSFNQYPATVQNIICKELDFNSYHRVQNVKNNLLKTTPDRTKPNFAGKYLLLKNEYLFDTVWFIADCESGKFLKETFSPSHKHPKVEFKADSALIYVTGEHIENKIEPQYHLFQNERWARVEETKKVEPITNTSSHPLPTSPANQETDIFAKYTISFNSDKCKPLDFKSYYRAQDNEKKITQLKPDLSTANFAGHYLLLKIETIFDEYWLLADCLTGKFFPQIINNGIFFKKDSRLIKLYSSGNFASYKVWSEEENQWIDIPDPNAKDVKTIKNSMSGKSSQILFSAIPNPDRSTTLRFENLKCTTDHCQVDLGKEKSVSITDNKIVRSLLQTWGNNGVIKWGRCVNENKSVKCDIEI